VKTYAYLLTDTATPATLHQVHGECPETGLVIVSPVDNPARVSFVYSDDLWVMASF
jgi:hypothetical protein